jgi:hypothetical protein
VRLRGDDESFAAASRIFVLLNKTAP